MLRHLSYRKAAEYVAGSISGAELEEIELHVVICDECLERLELIRLAERFANRATALMTFRYQVASLPRRASRTRPLLSVAAAAIAVLGIATPILRDLAISFFSEPPVIAFSPEPLPAPEIGFQYAPGYDEDVPRVVQASFVRASEVPFRLIGPHRIVSEPPRDYSALFASVDVAVPEAVPFEITPALFIDNDVPVLAPYQQPKRNGVVRVLSILATPFKSLANRLGT